MKFVCTICYSEAFHNEKLGIHFCKEHGFTVMPDVAKGLPVPVA